MPIYYAILATVVVAVLITVAVHLIRTLAQVQATAREAELLARKANAEMDKVGSVTTAMSGLASTVGGTGSRIAFGVANLLLQGFQRYRKARPLDADTEEEPETERQRSRT